MKLCIRHKADTTQQTCHKGDIFHGIFIMDFKSCKTFINEMGEFDSDTIMFGILGESFKFKGQEKQNSDKNDHFFITTQKGSKY